MTKNNWQNSKIFKFFSGENIDVLDFLLSFMGVILIRIFIDYYLVGQVTLESSITALHNFFFFFLLFLIIWLSLAFVIGIKPGKIVGFFYWGMWIIILPPIFDMLKTGGNVYWSFYAVTEIKLILAQFFTFFGMLPPGNVYFGSKIGFIITIFFSGVIVFLFTKSWLKSFIGALFSYICIFLMGAFPSWFFFGQSIFFGQKPLFEVKDFEIVQFYGGNTGIFGLSLGTLEFSFPFSLNIIYYLLVLIVASLLLYLSHKEKFLALVRNIRPPQILYHWGLLGIGLALGYLSYPDKFNLNMFSILAVFDMALAVALAWVASVIFNDIEDFHIDEISNQNRPLQQKVFSVNEYRRLGIAIFIFSLIGALTISPKFMFLLLLYQTIAWFYSVRPMRLKRIPFVGTFASAFASVIILFIGYNMFSGEDNIEHLSWRIIFLIIIAFTFVLPIKDFKDIEGDRKNEVWTIPVVFGEKKARWIVGASIFLSFIASVFVLNERKLFFPALIFGTLAFLLISSPKIKPRQFFWWVLGIAFCYGLILVWTIFA
jgi:4-hydroxybenzoate polyprenyltransferase